MKKVVLHDPVIIAQSTTEPILFGGYQDPFIRRNEQGDLLVRFNARPDKIEYVGQEDANPVYKSTDGGKIWTQLTDTAVAEWAAAAPRQKNGESFTIRENKPIFEIDNLPPVGPERNSHACCTDVIVYLADELAPLFGDRMAHEFLAYRKKAGSDEITEEICKINWDRLPAEYYPGKCVVLSGLNHNFKIDRDGVMWTTMSTSLVDDDGNLFSPYRSLVVFNSKDGGRNWDYVSAIPYCPEFNVPTAIDVEGFLEATLEFLDDGSAIAVMRSGSLSPFEVGDDDHPAPIMMWARSTDGCRTWTKPEKFYDYGILPRSYKLDCGTIILSSGRPGIILHVTHDPAAREWEHIPVIEVPKEDIYPRYYEYTCCNTDVVVTGPNELYMTYSDFTLTTPDGVRAKSILVRRVTVEEA